MSVTPIDALLSRRSAKLVGAPAPTPEHLSLILRAAMTAPDHGRAQPWRFTLIEGAAVAEFGEFVLRAQEAAGEPMPEQKANNMRGWLAQAPLLMGLACHLDPADKRFPDQERILASGAAVTQMLNAAHMLGYGAFWSTGLGTYLPAVQQELGFAEPEYRFLGFMSIGTPLRTMPPAMRPDPETFVRRWPATA